MSYRGTKTTPLQVMLNPAVLPPTGSYAAPELLPFLLKPTSCMHPHSLHSGSGSQLPLALQIWQSGQSSSQLQSHSPQLSGTLDLSQISVRVHVWPPALIMPEFLQELWGGHGGGVFGLHVVTVRQLPAQGSPPPGGSPHNSPQSTDSRHSVKPLV